MIEIQLVGATRVRSGTHVVEGRGFGGTKPRQLLEVLALQVGTPVSKERLADLLWDGEPPATYLGTLEGYVCVLRGNLQPGCPARRSVVRTVPGGYLLDAEQVAVDAEAVHALVVRARAARPGEALGLLRQALAAGSGELLAGTEGSSWAESARSAHTRQMVDAGTLAARHALALGHLDLAVTLADDALALDPMAEPACCLAMRALWSAGRTADALRRYGALRRVLADELGADPGPETNALMGRLLRDEPAPTIPYQRRCSDLAAAGSGDGRVREVDLLVGTLVSALRRSTATAQDAPEDPVLIDKLQALLHHLQATAAAGTLLHSTAA